MELPKRPCSSPGCPRLATHESRCQDHQRAVYQRQDAERQGSTARGYDPAHRRLRILCFQRDGWRCVDCLWEPDIIRDFRRYDLGEPPTDRILAELKARFKRHERHLHADHEIRIEARPDLRLSLANLRTRCNACHSAKTMREQQGTWRDGPTVPPSTVRAR